MMMVCMQSCRLTEKTLEHREESTASTNAGSAFVGISIYTFACAYQQKGHQQKGRNAWDGKSPGSKSLTALEGSQSWHLNASTA